MEGPDLMETLTMLLENGTVFIFKNCYIFMNIAMMIWSIMYHSWLTFLLLIWANILWIIPNQRSTMLKSSPFVVIYAELLLIAQFLYGMHLPDDVLPTRVDVSGSFGSLAASCLYQSFITDERNQFAADWLHQGSLFAMSKFVDEIHLHAHVLDHAPSIGPRAQAATPELHPGRYGGPTAGYSGRCHCGHGQQS